MAAWTTNAFILSFLFLINEETMSTSKILSVEYEVYGKVQGVFFRKFTQQESKKLGVRGWCMNTDRGTVQGVLEGEESKINHMKNWLRSVGSPSSRIEKADFKNEKTIPKFTFSNFSIKR